MSTGAFFFPVQPSRRRWCSAVGCLGNLPCDHVQIIALSLGFWGSRARNRTSVLNPLSKLFPSSKMNSSADNVQQDKHRQLPSHSHIWWIHNNFFFFFFGRAASVAYGGSQAKGQIRATAASLCYSHSNTGSKPCLDLYHSSWQCRILNSLSEARDRSHNLMVPSWDHFHFATVGKNSCSNSLLFYLFIYF